MTSITLANGISSLSYTEYNNANGKLVTAGLTISNVSVAKAGTVNADNNVSSILVTGATATDLDTATLGTLAKVTSITLANVVTSLSYVEYNNANGKLTASDIAITGVTAANLDTSTLGTQANVTSIALASGVTSLSYAEYINAKGKLASTGLTITGVTVANASIVVIDSNVTAIRVIGVTTSDLDTTSLGAQAKVNSITLASGVTSLSCAE